jgi:hypothetical protein
MFRVMVPEVFFDNFNLYHDWKRHLFKYAGVERARPTWMEEWHRALQPFAQMAVAMFMRPMIACGLVLSGWA